MPENHAKVHQSQSYSWFHLKYFYALVVLSFIVVSIPMVAALFTGFSYVDKLTNQSQMAVSRAVKTTQLSRLLVNQTTAMERSIRQYFVLKNDSILAKYYGWHGKYLETATTLADITLSQTLKEQLVALNNMESNLYDKVLALEKSKNKDLISPQDFIALSQLAQAILNDSDKLINSELQIMDELSNKAQDSMNQQLIWMAPLSIAFIFWFTRLIANPILQLDKQIRLLGSQKFDQKILVRGPRDLRALGERLDWLRTQLSYMETMKTEFLQSVSHELKTPLTAIRESAELLSEEVAGPLSEKQKKVCNILQKNSVSLQKMIEKLLSFNMSHAARDEDSRKNVYLVQLLEQVLADHEAIILSKNLHIEKKLENWIYQAKEEEIRVVMDNLLSNAVKYAPIGSKIEITLRGKNDEIFLDVCDQGSGISEKDRKRVFEAFYRGEPAEKGVIKGSGLGLSIAKEFVEAHKGKIELLDEN
ncbi:MAG: HAMP domain-containing sensor histidine kinase, partial [Gammaproteobacteria bacterium]|nr:HAMP domain-containing sensor histidine kinase [Gammaproteobacteria bacterium]